MLFSTVLSIYLMCLFPVLLHLVQRYPLSFEMFDFSKMSFFFSALGFYDLLFALLL